ncbi:MAG: ADP-ribosylglycohydrolase family protein [Actinomycetes bacterium]
MTAAADPSPQALDRAQGALLGLAVGDAMGMPTQLLTRTEATAVLGDPPGLRSGAADHPVAAGLPVGSITDDTEQALLLARLLIAGTGRVNPYRLAEDLLAWEASMLARGSADLLGPSTRRALRRVAEGEDPASTGTEGTTNGAAMRITPVGIATGPAPLARLVRAVVDADRPTHHTSVAHAGAAAVATVVSLGIEGVGFDQAWPVAVEAARLAAGHGTPVPGARTDRRITWAVHLAQEAVARGGVHTALVEIDELVGTSLATTESVPAAFAVAALRPDDPWAAVGLAARLGGDSDTIAAITGAMLGASHGPGGFPAEVRRTVESVNDLDLTGLAGALVSLRTSLGRS